MRMGAFSAATRHAYWYVDGRWTTISPQSWPGKVATGLGLAGRRRSGDPGLITALGLQALSQADVILYDALVDETLLTLATAEKSMPASAPACAAASRTKSPTCW